MRASTIVASLLVLAAISCSSKSSTPESCPNDLPEACPTTGAPSYAQTIAPIFEARCKTCHREGGQASGKTFDTYDRVFTDRRAILNQVYSCSMPPSSGEALGTEERGALLNWFVCGAPDN